MSAATVGVDIGGTKIVGLLTDEHGSVAGRVTATTPPPSAPPAEVEQTILGVVDRVVREAADVGDAVRAVGIGAAGLVRPDRATVAFSPHLSWRDEPLGGRLSARLGLPVVVDNDATAAAVAEVRLGAGRGHDRVLLVAVGTGIGGSWVRSGEPDRGHQGMAGELGHLCVVPGGRPCECGLRGCWEQYCSGNALRRAAASVAGSGQGPRAWLDGRRDPGVGPLVSAAAAQGDDIAVGLLRDCGRWLGHGLAQLTAVLDPEVVVVTGGLAGAGDLLLEPAREALASGVVARSYRRLPEVRTGTVPDAAAVGAALLAREVTRPPRR